MTLLIRFILISIIIYLIFRSFARFFEEKDIEAHDRENNHQTRAKSKGVSKEIGEYTDYEEVD